LYWNLNHSQTDGKVRTELGADFYISGYALRIPNASNTGGDLGHIKLAWNWTGLLPKEDTKRPGDIEGDIVWCLNDDQS
jgi:hypothetical protein